MLKKVISLLLSKFYSKQESELVGRQAFPSTSSVQIQLTPSNGSENKEVQYVPPTDGYIVLRDVTLPSNGTAIISGQYANGVTRGETVFDAFVMTPVVKGVPANLRYCGKNPAGQFIRIIGEGVSSS